MAGQNSGFSASGFRSAIKFAMQMGAPEATTKRASFAWTTRRTFALADQAENPFDWTATPATEVVNSAVQVDCAIEFLDQPNLITNAGRFANTKLVITILDDDYALIFDDEDVRADLVIVDGNTYEIEFEAPPVGLFEVTVHQLHAKARDES